MKEKLAYLYGSPELDAFCKLIDAGFSKQQVYAIIEVIVDLMKV